MSRRPARQPYQMRLPAHMFKYVVVSRETAAAIKLHDEMMWESSSKYTDAISPCGGLHIDHRAALVAINDMMVALRYIGRLIQKEMENGTYTEDGPDGTPF